MSHQSITFPNLEKRESFATRGFEPFKKLKLLRLSSWQNAKRGIMALRGNLLQFLLGEATEVVFVVVGSGILGLVKKKGGDGD